MCADLQPLLSTGRHDPFRCSRHTNVHCEKRRLPVDSNGTHHDHLQRPTWRLSPTLPPATVLWLSTGSRNERQSTSQASRHANAATLLPHVLHLRHNSGSLLQTSLACSFRHSVSFGSSASSRRLYVLSQPHRTPKDRYAGTDAAQDHLIFGEVTSLDCSPRHLTRIDYIYTVFLPLLECHQLVTKQLFSILSRQGSLTGPAWQVKRSPLTPPRQGLRVRHTFRSVSDTVLV